MPKLYGSICAVLLTLFFLSVIGIWFYLARTSDPRMGEAYASYLTGERATSVAQRTAAFNRALELYTSLDKEYHPAWGNGKLAFNMGNSYFQLGQYPWAILYYLRAEQLMPQRERVIHNVLLTQEKLEIPEKTETSLLPTLFFFHYQYSLPQRLQLFFFCSLAAFLLASFTIWWQQRWIDKLVTLFAILAAVVLSSALVSQYLDPIEGVLVEASFLYRDAGEQYAKVSPNLIQAGSVVEVLETVEEGKWLKVVTPDGTLGYVAQPSVRLI